MSSRFVSVRFWAPALAGFVMSASLLSPSQALAQSCLTSAEMRENINAKKVIAPAEALRSARGAAQGDAVRMRLCRTDDNALIYAVTMVKKDGRVHRVTIDASSGKVSTVR